jgi:hypothetical protein
MTSHLFMYRCCRLSSAFLYGSTHNQNTHIPEDTSFPEAHRIHFIFRQINGLLWRKLLSRFSLDHKRDRLVKWCQDQQYTSSPLLKMFPPISIRRKLTWSLRTRGSAH